MVVTDSIYGASDGTTLHDHHLDSTTDMTTTAGGAAGSSGTVSKRTSAPWLVATTATSTSVPATVISNR